MTRLPTDQQRIAIVGRTGSGKTRAGMWHLSQRDFHNMRWVIVDYKGDDLIAASPAQEIDFTKPIKKTMRENGLYVIRPLPEVDDEDVELFLRQIWMTGNTGVYVDEGYMLPDGVSLRGLLTQGRSKHIPMIILSQRPVWMSRFVFSEADFYQLFHLNDKRDKQSIGAFMPEKAKGRLPDYHSWYYDVGKDDLVTLGPVPDDKGILAGFSVPEWQTKKKRRLLFT